VFKRIKQLFLAIKDEKTWSESFFEISLAELSSLGPLLKR